MPYPYKKYSRPQQPRVRRNEQIRAPEVRVIDENGENLGIMTSGQALTLAKERQLDLIEISATAKPPVVKIMEYGKYMYQQEKKDREARKKQGVVTTKGVRIGMRTSDHDIHIKAQAVDKFLKRGYKVRVELLMRGREKTLRSLADKKLKEFLNALTESNTIEQGPKEYPRGLYLILNKGKK